MIPTFPAPTTSPLMPQTLEELIRSRTMDKSITMTLMDIPPMLNGQESELASAWLNGEELLQLKNYSFEKRRTEWLSGRICAKQAVLKLLNGDGINNVVQPYDIAIKNDPSGRPSLHIGSSTHPVPEIDISISHSHGRAAALAGRSFCGIDIQHLNYTLFKVKHRYCTDIEAAMLDGIPTNELVQLGLLWVAKEAVKKCLSVVELTGFHEIVLEQVSEEQGYYLLHFRPDAVFSRTDQIVVIAHFSGPFAIAFCSVARERLYAGTA